MLATAIVTLFASSMLSPQVDGGRASGVVPEGLVIPEARTIAGAHDVKGRLAFIGQDGERWINAEGYKARIGDDGLTFIPFLGSAAARNWPARFHLRSIRCGDHEIPLAPKPTLLGEGARMVLDHGPAQCIHDFDPMAVAQSFAVDARGMQGDMVLALDVETDLVSEQEGAGWRFTTGRGGISYGAAFAVLPDGELVPIKTERTRSGLTMRVPGRVVAESGGNVLIDPTVRPFVVDDFTRDQRRPDVVMSAEQSFFLPYSQRRHVVYEEVFSSTDSDILLMTEEGGVNELRFLDTSNRNWTEPAIAYLNPYNRLLVVATRELSGGTGGGLGEIVGRLVHTDDLTAEPTFVIGLGGGAASLSNSRPDVAGAFDAASEFFLVSFERRFSATRTHPRLVTIRHDGLMGTTFLPEGGGNIECTQVVVSQTEGDESSRRTWNVAYQKKDLLTGETWIRGLQMLTNGTVVEFTDDLLTLPAGIDAASLSVSGSPRSAFVPPTYIVAYDPFGPGDADVDLLTCLENELQAVTDANFVEHGPLNANQERPVVMRCAREYTVVYQERVASEWVVFASTFEVLNNGALTLKDRRVPLGSAGSSPFATKSALSDAVSGGTNPNGAAGDTHIVWARENPGTGFDIVGAEFFGSPRFRSRGTNDCYGTPNSTGDRGWMRLMGPASLTSTIQAEGFAMPPFQFGMLLSGSAQTTSGALPGSIGVFCLGGQLGRYTGQIFPISPDGGRLVVDVDPTALLTPSSTFPATSGLVWNFQFWHRDAGTSGPTSNLTNAVSIMFE